MDLMSTAQLLGNFGEFFGAIAVLATLIYLSIQTRQTRKATQETAKIAAIEGTWTGIECYDRWRSSIVENSDLARIMVKARGKEPLDASEEVIYEQLFERLFYAGAAAVEASVREGTVHSWVAGDVAYLLDFFAKNPAGTKQWERHKDLVRSVSPAYVDAVDAELSSR